MASCNDDASISTAVVSLGSRLHAKRLYGMSMLEAARYRSFVIFVPLRGSSFAAGVSLHATDAE